MNRFATGTVVSLLIGLLAYSPAHGADSGTDGDLKEVEKALQQEQKQSDALQRKSEDLERELGEIAKKLVAAAREVQDHEQTITELEERIAVLRVEEADKAAKLIGQREKFARVLMSLERLARFPPEAMIAQPTSPSDTVRSAILLRSVVPEIERRAERLRQQIVGLATSRERLNNQQEALQRNQQALAEQSQTLGGLLAQKKLLKKQTDAEQKQAAKRAAKLAREAETLRELIAGLQEEHRAREAEAALQAAVQQETSGGSGAETTTETASLIPAPPPKPSGALSGLPISSRKGKLPFPAMGTVVARYGENNENGMTQRGIEVATRPSAQVVAPYEGQVVFVGEFRGYGQLLIIEHSEGYHSLLAGMARIDSEMGQWVLVGEPVGIMEPARDAEPILYVELRRDGQPINPLPWLSSRAASTQG